MADAVEPGRERRHAALLRLAAEDPVDVAIGRQRAGRGVGVGRLAVVDVDDIADRRRPAPGDAAGRDRLRVPPTIFSRGTLEPAAGRPGAGGVLRIVVARQGRHVGEIDGVAVGVDQHAGAERNAAGDGTLERHRHGDDAGTRRASCRRHAREGSSSTPITAQSPALLAGEDVLLGGDIARHVAMAVDMVGRDVEPDRDMGAEGLAAARAGRTTARAHRCRPAERREVERAAADIAADLAARAGLGQDMADQRRGGRLAVGAGDADEARLRLGTGQQLDVADDLLAGGARRRGHGMRLGQAVGNAGADAPAPSSATSRWPRARRRERRSPAAARARRRCRPRRRSRSRPPSGRAPSPGRSAPAPARRTTNP